LSYPALVALLAIQKAMSIVFSHMRHGVWIPDLAIGERSDAVLRTAMACPGRRGVI
jgi:hypothetical protein